MPIIFVAVTDPVALGMVESLARPGGNATGFSPAEVDLSAKWVQVLKEMVPTLTRIAVFQNPVNLGGVPQFAAVQNCGGLAWRRAQHHRRARQIGDRAGCRDLCRPAEWRTGDAADI